LRRSSAELELQRLHPTFFYGVTGITPAMAMRMTGIGRRRF
jgi:hypothetical protein